MSPHQSEQIPHCSILVVSRLPIEAISATVVFAWQYVPEKRKSYAVIRHLLLLWSATTNTKTLAKRCMFGVSPKPRRAIIWISAGGLTAKQEQTSHTRLFLLHIATLLAICGPGVNLPQCVWSAGEFIAVGVFSHFGPKF